jgi:DNA modification methylase
LIELENAVVYHGSNLDVLPTLPDNSVDAIVTDPPYELGFMGKSWDSSGIAYSVELWAECLRVLKPGGHLLAFGGSRTWHRIAVAIEDAGFDVRDSIAWLYGSGFPKSLDISKAIDKVNGEGARVQNFVSYMKTTGLKPKEIDEALKKAGLISQTSNRAVHYFNDGQPQIPTWEMWQVIRPMIADVPFEIDLLVDRVEAEREVIGTKISGIANAEEKDRHTIGASKAVEVNITAPATDEAKKWQGWGTALKPAFEPIVVARKPLVGTVAANVLEWGVGGLNIDGSRIAGESWGSRPAHSPKEVFEGGWTPKATESAPAGRWPANIILDEHTAGLLDEQSGISTSLSHNRPQATKWGFGVHQDNSKQYDYETGQTGYGDTGGASRFFYVAKASKKDRNEGLEDLPDVHPSEVTGRKEGSAGASNGGYSGMTETPRKNIHPTVKPTALMEYLVKLVTPPGGTVLDPFTGSGSTGKAALLNGFKFIGIELTEDYLPIIEGRLKHAAETYAVKATEEETKEQETLF